MNLNLNANNKFKGQIKTKSFMKNKITNSKAQSLLREK